MAKVENLGADLWEEDGVISETESVILNPEADSQLSFLFHQHSQFDNHHSNSDNTDVADDDFCVGLRVAVFGSDSDINEDDYCLDRVNFGNNFDYDSHDDDDGDSGSVSTPLCWDSLQLEDRREGNEDFEWVVDEGEVVNDDEEASVSSVIVAESAGGLGNLEWEVLLNDHNLDTNTDPESDRNGEPYYDDYIYTGEYETFFGQFVENEMALMGRPPAAKSVVDKLPAIVFTQEDVDGGNSLCAICKDDINVGEKAKQLPCSHRYHGECIVPWLGIRNTCPVCRHELPTHDVEYERRKAALRAAVSAHRM